MRVTENTTKRLTLAHRPWIMTIGAWITVVAPLLLAILDVNFDSTGQRLLVGAIGLGGIWLVWRYLAFYTLIFDREAGFVSHHLHRVTGTTSHHIPLDQIEEARIEVQWHDGDRVQRLVLRLADGPVPMEMGFGSGMRQPVADAINEWLTRP